MTNRRTPKPDVVNPPQRMVFGAALRQARLDAGLTQEDLAERLGMRRPTPISSWERSAHVPEPGTIKRLADAIGCPPAKLLRGVVTPYDELREYTASPAADSNGALTDDDREWLALGRAAGAPLRRSLAAMLIEVIRERADPVGRPRLDVVPSRPARRSSGAATAKANDRGTPRPSE
jgi:transcriptional regulator with XRE-family HTH domain